MWLSGLTASLWTKRLQVQFPVRAHAWVAGQVPSWGCARGNGLMFLSHSFSLPYPLSENKQTFFKDFILFIFRQRGREGEREGEKSQCVVASRAPPTGDLAHNPVRHVPWLGIKPATLWFSGRCSIHWATPARATKLLQCIKYEKQKCIQHTDQKVNNFF